MCHSNTVDNFINEKDMVTLTCNANYTGNWAPVMEWTDKAGSFITTNVVNMTVPHKSVSSSLTVQAFKNVSGSTFACRTYFSQDNKPRWRSDEVTDIPAFSYTWLYRLLVNITGATV